jgi:hypothetical protein
MARGQRDVPRRVADAKKFKKLIGELIEHF